MQGQCWPRPRRKPRRGLTAGFQGVDYPLKNQRGKAVGKITVVDPLTPMLKSEQHAGGDDSADPRPARPSIGNWTPSIINSGFRADAKGRFKIPNIRPGTYTSAPIADGVLGEFSKAGVVVDRG